MRILFLPIDNRPVCYSLPKDIIDIDSSLNIELPPRELLGDLHKSADTKKLFEWIKNVPECDVIILSLDTIAYGGLIPSRRSEETYETIKTKLLSLKEVLKSKSAKILAFSSIMRISNNNYNEEEKEYWKDIGKKIFEYSFSGGKNLSDIPNEIIEDYLATRKRNFEINKLYLEWQKEGLFETLIFSKDDCAESGFNVNEAKELEKMGATIKTGADEIPLSLLARAIQKNINVYVEYTEPNHKHLISNYEDISIENTVLGQLELCGFNVVQEKSLADIVLIVNNFRNKQGELVMDWETTQYSDEFVPPEQNYAIADVRNANGADNNFIDQALKKLDLENFYGYAAWNTSANTIGSLLAIIKVKYNAKNYNENSFKKLQMIRFLDDWAYQANVRKQINKPCDISERIKEYEKKLIPILKPELTRTISYSFPWERTFEIEVNIG